MTEPLYRLNVGIALFNRAGQVLIARRLRDDGPEIVLPGHEWQMPQGGVDPDEDLVAAARRELWEETNVTHASYLAETVAWVTYDFPSYDGPPHRLSPFRGQQQRWVAFRFEGSDGEIEVTQSRGGMEPEFSEWRWEALDRLPALVVPFKRKVYEHVALEFQALAEV
ncbi:putative (di)nucleoside polyphosphate hydrolase [Microvirga lupini]|uniref:Putative (Di)nucleoside polyphosphate hydrolase n=1 Tax=Microvirga lupini TaxID=420324 RepID=A0A7W4YXX5_9HYPH|nr:RNA pyrophosphohydrolase [Microvirga lupini]MBB3020511.1 putative (di)nucleoside polyphosphate hydrolase [Microvirga lupini]